MSDVTDFASSGRIRIEYEDGNAFNFYGDHFDWEIDGKKITPEDLLKEVEEEYESSTDT